MGGYGNEYVNGYLSSVELFPPSDACSIPDLPQGRYGHSLSLLSGGRLVVCGGYDYSSFLNSCNFWVAGDTSWTPFHTMRCLLIIFKSHNHLHQITVRRDIFTLHGRRLLFPTPLCCSAAMTMQQSSLQRRCQVTFITFLTFIFTEIKLNDFHIFSQVGAALI